VNLVTTHTMDRKNKSVCYGAANVTMYYSVVWQPKCVAHAAEEHLCLLSAVLTASSLILHTQNATIN
jgi:hypothetical protein